MKLSLKIKKGVLWTLAAFIILTMISPATAESAGKKSAAEFYKGKIIKWYVPATPGGGYDTVTRAFAPYIKKYTGARKVIVINKPGGGMMLAPVHVYTATKPDGLSLCTVQTLSAFMAQLIGKAGMENIDIAKFNWLASVAYSPITLYINSKLPYKSLVDLKKAKGFKFGLTGTTGTPAMVCVGVLQGALGMEDLKPILGIESSAEVTLAIVRGEYDGTSLPLRSCLKYVKNGTIRPIALITKDRNKDLPDLPTIYEALEGVKITEDQKFWIDRVVFMNELYRTMVTTPGAPQDRVELLREAFKKSFQEKELLAKGEKLRLRLKYVSGEDVANEIGNFLNMTPERKAQLKKRLKF